MIVLAIFGVFFLLVGCYMVYRSIMIAIIFKRGHNPYNRICKRCGAHQDMYQSNIEGNESDFWWEEVYPIGNNPNCKCHKYASYRN